MVCYKAKSSEWNEETGLFFETSWGCIFANPFSRRRASCIHRVHCAHFLQVSGESLCDRKFIRNSKIILGVGIKTSRRLQSSGRLHTSFIVSSPFYFFPLALLEMLEAQLEEAGTLKRLLDGKPPLSTRRLLHLNTSNSYQRISHRCQL